MIMENTHQHLNINEIDDFLNALKKSCNVGYDVHFKNSRFKIITSHDYPNIYLIKNTATGTLFSPSKDLQSQIDFVKELSNEI